MYGLGLIVVFAISVFSVSCSQDQSSKYVEQLFSFDITGNKDIGELKVYCTLFKVRNDEKTVKEYKKTIKDEFFKNNMSVAFSLNGQVHGFYTSEFITRSLKWPLFKSYLLIHVDCTKLSMHYRNNMFMASRDRLKNAKEADAVRQLLADRLRKSALSDLYKQRKDSFSAETGDANDLLKKFSKNLPLNPEMLKLLKHTFKLEELNHSKKDETPHKDKKKNKPKETEPFISKRYPSIFKIDGKPDKDGKVVKTIPIGGDRIIKFSTDAENEYFDRIRDKGDLRLFILKQATNKNKGGDAPGLPREIEDSFQVVKSNPHEGTIRVNLQPKDDIGVGDEFEIQANLSSVAEPDDALSCIFYVKIEEMKKKEPKPEEINEPHIGLPELVLVYKDERENVTTWNTLEEHGIAFDEQEIMATLPNDKDELEKIFVNMDSSLLRSYKSRIDGDEALQVADNKYVSQVYFHTLFLYSTLKQRKYTFALFDEPDNSKELDEVLQDLFKSSYGEFLLRFGGTEELISAIE